MEERRWEYGLGDGVWRGCLGALWSRRRTSHLKPATGQSQQTPNVLLTPRCCHCWNSGLVVLERAAPKSAEGIVSSLEPGAALLARWVSLDQL